MVDIQQNTDPEHVRKIQEIMQDQGEDSAADQDLLVMSTGVVLRTHRVSPFLYNQVLERFQDPPVPKVYDKDSERDIENPMHPAYIQAKNRVEMDRGSALTDLFIGLGTTPEHVPDELVPLDEDTWIIAIRRHISNEEYEAIAQDDSYRYIAWVKYIATASTDDIAAIMDAINRKLGVQAEVVAGELEKFRSDEA